MKRTFLIVFLTSICLAVWQKALCIFLYIEKSVYFRLFLCYNIKKNCPNPLVWRCSNITPVQQLKGSCCNSAGAVSRLKETWSIQVFLKIRDEAYTLVSFIRYELLLLIYYELCLYSSCYSHVHVQDEWTQWSQYVNESIIYSPKEKVLWKIKFAFGRRKYCYYV